MNDNLIIPFADFSFQRSFIDEVSEILNSIPKNKIAYSPWEFKFSGSADFSIAYSNDAVLLKFFIVEEDIRAVYIEPNDPVFRDSCVEFFIAFAGDTDYYNFEFNCKGNCQAGYGRGKEDREKVPIALIESIRTMASFKTVYLNGKAMIKWELTLAIPTKVFCFHNLESFKNKIARVNFYKCGDDLPQPHYLCWNPIVSASPNFHLSQFFGNAFFKEN